jgi:hypothetical protein
MRPFEIRAGEVRVSVSNQASGVAYWCEAFDST